MNTWESIGIPGNGKAGHGYLGSHRNTWESIRIPDNGKAGDGFVFLFSQNKNPILRAMFGEQLLCESRESKGRGSFPISPLAKQRQGWRRNKL